LTQEFICSLSPKTGPSPTITRHRPEIINELIAKDLVEGDFILKLYIK